MIGRAAEMFAIFGVKSRDFQRKSGFFGFFKFENLMIDNCFHELLQEIIFFQDGPAMVMIGKIIFPDTLYRTMWM